MPDPNDELMVIMIKMQTSLARHNRGLDLIAADKESLRSIYEKYNDWILDNDREKIQKQFKKMESL